MIRHQEYLDRREKRMVITYHDNMFVPSDQEDIQQLALQQADGRVGYICKRILNLPLEGAAKMLLQLLMNS